MIAALVFTLLLVGGQTKNDEEFILHTPSDFYKSM
jgi:hypothetical protein